MGKLILLSFAIPVLDLMLLVRAGRAVGGWVVLLAVVVSAAAGLAIARAAGARALRDWREALAGAPAQGSGPLERLLILLGCVGLIVPGPVSDVLGLALLVRPLRSRLSERLRQSVQRALEGGSLRVTSVQRVYFGGSTGVSPEQPVGFAGRPDDPRRVIDVKAEVIERGSDDTTHKRLLP